MGPNCFLKLARLYGEAIIPHRAYATDAGLDVFTPLPVNLLPKAFLKIPIGIACEFPPGYVLLVQARSGLAMKEGVFTIGNVIDSGYRGELHVGLANLSEEAIYFPAKSKIAQLLFLTCPNFPVEIVSFDTLSKSDRGSRGLGSTGA